MRHRLRAAAGREGRRESDVERELRATARAFTAYGLAKHVGPLKGEFVTGKLLIDTGPIVATLASSDKYNKACAEQFRNIRGPRLTCCPVVAEDVWRADPEAMRELLAEPRRNRLRLYARPARL